MNSDLQALLSQLQSGMANGTPGSSGTGMNGEVQEMMKALVANSNYTSDVATLEGGGALGVQSLDRAMYATLQEQEHFVLFNRLASSNATNLVDEYIRQTSIGGYLGQSGNTQMGVVRAATGDYSREVANVKFLMQLRQVGYILGLVDNAQDPMALEELNGAKALLTDAEYWLFHGNSAVSPVEYDGLFKLIDDAITAGQVSDDHIQDMNGTALTGNEQIAKIGAAVAQYGNWGKLTDLFMTTDVQTDLNVNLDPAMRWVPEGQNPPMTTGAHVSAIRLQNGRVTTNTDTFLQYDKHPMAMPLEVNWSAVAAANSAFKPASVVATTPVDSASRFTGARAGNYYYGVAGVGPTGEGMSAITATAQVAIAAGDNATLVITKSAGGTETGYAIYRSRQSGTADADDMRLVAVVPKAGATTTFIDQNRDMPGTTKVACLNLTPADAAIDWRKFGGMTKIPLPFGNGGQMVHSWFQFMSGYLRMTKPRHHGYIKNVLPANATWRPHTAE